MGMFTCMLYYKPLFVFFLFPVVLTRFYCRFFHFNCKLFSLRSTNEVFYFFIFFLQNDEDFSNLFSSSFQNSFLFNKRKTYRLSFVVCWNAIICVNIQNVYCKTKKYFWCCQWRVYHAYVKERMGKGNMAISMQCVAHALSQN